VVIDVEETEEKRIVREEAADLMRIGSIKRALRSKSGRAPVRFPRSHSTGHSLAAPAAAGGSERFTLRLPDHVLQVIVAAGRLQRTTSLLAFRAGSRAGTGEGSSRAGRSIRLGQSGRWPSFLSRKFSARLPAWGSRSSRRGDTGGSSKGGMTADGAGAKSVGGETTRRARLDNVFDAAFWTGSSGGREETLGAFAAVVVEISFLVLEFWREIAGTLLQLCVLH
jgi:E3 ubiquitin-protein ligase ATL6/9/15/31/42/55